MNIMYVKCKQCCYNVIVSSMFFLYITINKFHRNCIIVFLKLDSDYVNDRTLDCVILIILFFTSAKCQVYGVPTYDCITHN